MAQAARIHDQPTPDVAAPPTPQWSGELHGPVAALHQAIEVGLGATWEDRIAADLAVQGPVDRMLRIASRLTGWAVLAAAFVAVAIAIF